MNDPLVSMLASIRHRNLKYKGLQIMTIGFLSAVLGGATALIGVFLRTTVETLGVFLVYFGWMTLIIGAIVMLVGILIHWSSMFSSEKRLD